MKIDINSGWLFVKENGDRKIVCLPHDAMLEERRYASCRNSSRSGYFPGGKYTYIKELNISENDIAKDISLLFEGVYRNASIKVNGKLAATHKYGYSEFAVSLNDFLSAGSNSIRVEVDNSLFPNCRWYSGSGIYRPVWLNISSFEAPKTLRIETLSYFPAVVKVSTDDGASIAIKDASGELVYEGNPGEIEIKDAHLYSADNPYLYECVASKGGEAISSFFGIRKLEWDAKKGFLVNGKRTLLRGGCIHHDNGVLGACSFPDAERRRVKILKEQGFNAIRVSHNPASADLLEACDELGMYVIDEAFDGWYIPKDYHDFSRDFYSEYKEALATMVKRDFNHPSVIMYSLGNEVTETASKKGIDLCASMRDLVHSLDGTRPVTCGINVLLDVYVKKGLGVYKDKGTYKREPLPEGKKYKDKKAGSAFFNYWAGKLRGLLFFMSKGRSAEKVVRDIAPSLDVVGLNYASSRYDKDAKKYPDRLMVGTETMSADLPYNWARVKKYPQLFGDFVWAGWDYIGETCMGWTYESYKGLPLLANQGMIDITGKPLAQMAFLQIVWGMRKEPYIAVRPLNHAKETPSKGAWQFTDAIASWEWEGYEGVMATIEVYANAKYVTLYKNGEILGSKETKNMKAIFRTPYEKGTIRAVAVDDEGHETSSSLSSGQKETVLTVTPSKPIMEANKSDLCYVEIEFTDAFGVLKPYIEQEIELKVEGESASLVGLGSALCKSDEGFLSNRHTSYRGRALAVFRSTGGKGKTFVEISSSGVKPATIEIEAK